MAKSRSPNREKALKLYVETNGNIKLKSIAETLKEKIDNIYQWKRIDKWDEKIKNNVGPPKGSINAFKHGANINYEKRIKDKNFISKYVSARTSKILDDIRNSELTTLDILWTNIQLKYAAIISSQKIMEVKSKKELIKELKREKNTENTSEIEYEIQFAWDRQERFLKAQSSAMKVLNDMIKTYEELLNKNYDLANEEQRLRVEKLRLELKIFEDKDNLNTNINSTQKLNSILELLNNEE